MASIYLIVKQNAIGRLITNTPMKIRLYNNLCLYPIVETRDKYSLSLTHTHTHREREREREILCLLVDNIYKLVDLFTYI